MNSALVLLSGGLDSAVALAWAKEQYDPVRAITFDYYLRPARERLATFRLLQHYRASLIQVPVPFLKESGDFNSELNSVVEEGYISNRNMIFYSIAIHFAELHGCKSIIGGHTIEDHEAFPDASASFLHQLQELANQALQINRIQIELPLSKWTKLQVLEQAIEWAVPLECTWSCYWDRTLPCGECISCTERAQAFAHLAMSDPLCTT